MPNAVERVEEFLKAYGMSPSFTDVDACARAFQRDMERGLQAYYFLDALDGKYISVVSLCHVICRIIMSFCGQLILNES